MFFELLLSLAFAKVNTVLCIHACFQNIDGSPEKQMGPEVLSFGLFPQCQKNTSNMLFEDFGRVQEAKT